MKRVVDVYKDRGRELVWTYVIHLGNIEFHPAQIDFEQKSKDGSWMDHLNDRRWNRHATSVEIIRNGLRINSIVNCCKPLRSSERS